MRNYVQRGENLTLSAPVDVLSGDGVLVGSIFGVAAEDALTGSDVDLVTVGVFNLPKAASLVISTGDPVFWDNTARAVVKTASGNTRIGVATATAANPSAAVAVRLNGSF